MLAMDQEASSMLLFALSWVLGAAARKPKLREVPGGPQSGRVRLQSRCRAPLCSLPPAWGARGDQPGA